MKKIPYNFPYWGKLWGISVSRCLKMPIKSGFSGSYFVISTLSYFMGPVQTGTQKAPVIRG